MNQELQSMTGCDENEVQRCRCEKQGFCARCRTGIATRGEGRTENGAGALHPAVRVGKRQGRGQKP